MSRRAVRIRADRTGGPRPARDAPHPPLEAGRPPPRREPQRAPGTAGAPAESEAVTGESLRARREALGISQSAVAHAAHCSRGLVAEVERGKRRASQTLAHLSATLDKLELQLRRP